MNTISIPMADPMPDGFRQPEPVIIEISQLISDIKKEEGMVGCDLFLHEIWNKSKADQLADALLGALPQGLLEPLMIRLMEKRVSLYHGVMHQKG